MTFAPADADLVRALKERAGANDSIFYAHRVFAETDALARRHGLRPPRSVLEIGPGANLGALFAFTASGARAAGVDLAPVPPPTDGFYEALRDYLLVAEGFTWWRAWAEPQPGACGLSEHLVVPVRAGSPFGDRLPGWCVVGEAAVCRRHL